MNGGADERLRLGQIAFQGRIIANATHEFQNHFAVIKEYNGLISDLLNAKKTDTKYTVKRCSEITVNINERATQAAYLADVLNRFAHRGDTGACSFMPGEVVDDLAKLMRRQAAQRKLLLESSEEKNSPVLINNPSLFQYLIFLLVKPWLGSLGEGGRIALRSKAGLEGAAIIEMRAERVMQPLQDGSSEEREIVDICLQKLAATLDVQSGGSGSQLITLTLRTMVRTA